MPPNIPFNEDIITGQRKLLKFHQLANNLPATLALLRFHRNIRVNRVMGIVIGSQSLTTQFNCIYIEKYSLIKLGIQILQSVSLVAEFNYNRKLCNKIYRNCSNKLLFYECHIPYSLSITGLTCSYHFNMLNRINLACQTRFEIVIYTLGTIFEYQLFYPLLQYHCKWMTIVSISVMYRIFKYRLFQLHFNIYVVTSYKCLRCMI